MPYLSYYLFSYQVLDLVNLIGGEVDQVQENNPTVESLSTLLEKMRKLLHKNHFHCFQVSHSLIQLIGRQPGHQIHQLSDIQLQNKLSKSYTFKTHSTVIFSFVKEMCQDLLATTTALDPTSSRLKLYSSVIQVELYNTILALVKRDAWDQAVTLGLLQDAKKQLLAAKKSLEPEEPASAGEKLKELVQNSLDELAAFCSLNHISLCE